MADAKPTMVTVETLKYHTTNGKPYDVGDTYDVEESAVDSLATQGMAVRTDRVAHAKAAAKAAAAPAKAPKAAKAKRGKK